MVNMYHSVITPHSYHGYQSLAEDRTIPAKIGCSTRAHRSERDWFENTRKQLAEPSIGERSSLNQLSNVTLHRNTKSEYGGNYRPPTVEKVMEVPSTKHILLHHHNNYRRENTNKKHPQPSLQGVSTNYGNTHANTDIPIRLV
jgi:hypothetical protein